MDSLANTVGEFVERGKEAEKLSEAGGDGYGDDGVPNEESNN